MAWFKTWFDTPYYHLLYKNRDFREAEKFITHLTDFLHLQKNSFIIDLACGKGRHSVYLNKLGFTVLGVDLSQQSIEHNKQFENETLHFEVHDMRDKLHPEPVSSAADAVLNLFTSFGYFDTEGEDRQVFTSVSEVLKPGGYFVLDFLNEHVVRKTLVPHQEAQRENILFDIRKNVTDDFVIKDITFTSEGQAHHYQEKVRLHTLEEIKNYGSQAGLKPIEIFGDYDLKTFDKETSPRCIVVFKKEG